MSNSNSDNNNNNNNNSNNINKSNNSNNKSWTVKSGSGCSKSVCSNWSITNSDCTIDERVLVDPKLLFIGAKIGEGAHGKVYEGRYGDRFVAIKVLNRGSNIEERALLEDRFAREVNMTSRVKHDNLVNVVTFYYKVIQLDNFVL